jgi:hypothetical protein
MDTLQEIVFILDRYKVRQIEVLTNADNPKDSRYAECFNGLRAGKWPTDRELAEHFGFEQESKSFVRFKNEVKKRLYNSLLFIDHTLPGLNEYEGTFMWLMQQWAMAQTLFHKGATHTGMELAEQLLPIALKYEHYNTAFEIIKAIQTNATQIPAYWKDFAKIQEQYREIKEIYTAEITAREAYEELVFPLVHKKGFKKSHADEARALTASLKPQADRIQSIFFQNFYRIIDLYGDVLEHNWNAALEKARDAKEFFLQKKVQPIFFISAFANQEAGCLVMLNRFSEARTVVAEMLTVLEEGSFNWFKMQELDTVACFYATDYVDAWNTCRAMIKHPRFKEISAADQENWRLFQGYLYLLAKADALQLPLGEKGEVEKFRLSSWLNDLPMLSQDKRGSNIPILLIQAFFLLLDDRMDEFDNRIEALRKYRQRNLSPDDEHFRTDCFIRLLELVPKNGYKIAAIKAEAPKWLEKMSSVSTDILDRSYEIEVVPYERMWRWLTNILERKPMEARNS